MTVTEVSCKIVFDPTVHLSVPCEPIGVCVEVGVRRTGENCREGSGSLNSRKKRWFCYIIDSNK